MEAIIVVFFAIGMIKDNGNTHMANIMTVMDIIIFQNDCHTCLYLWQDSFCSQPVTTATSLFTVT